MMLDRLNSDPLAAMVDLLRPKTVLSQVISGAGAWAVQYPPYGQPSFGLMLSGACWFRLEGQDALQLEAGDFVLLPATPGFRTGSSLAALDAPVVRSPEGDAALAQAVDSNRARELRHGDADGEPNMRMLGGFFLFDPNNASLLTSLLPAMVHIKATDAGADRLVWLVRAIGEEASAQRPGATPILVRLVEVLLLEALRWRPVQAAAPWSGLLAGLADPRLAVALRCLHADVSRRWTIASLAREAGLSRAAFAARFAKTLGVPPMEYLLRWRMALAKDLLRREGVSLTEVADAIGYQSASAFSTAFSRAVGQAPSAFARSSHGTAT
jgi:AraC-like DNA-binding protein